MDALVVPEFFDMRKVLQPALVRQFVGTSSQALLFHEFMCWIEARRPNPNHTTREILLDWGILEVPETERLFWVASLPEMPGSGPYHLVERYFGDRVRVADAASARMEEDES
jgi:hypothetical protein